MNFKDWVITETSLEDLHQSAVDAFPNTQKRQHAVNPIKIEEIRWLPYLGVKTLFVKAQARNEDRQYSPMVLFKGVKYHKTNAAGRTRLKTEHGTHFFEKLSLEDSDVLLRCQCGDFHWRFNYFDHLDKVLYGSKRKKYEAKYNPGSANPQKMPGMCKHLMKLMSVLGESGIVG